MSRRRSLAVGSGALLLAVLATGCEPPSPWHAEMVTVNNAGEPGTPATSGGYAVSPDGTKVAFASAATNLVADGLGDGTFLRDLATHTTTRLSPTWAYGIAFSPDGTKVVEFETTSSGSENVVIRDVATGTPTVVASGVYTLSPQALTGYPPQPTAQWSPDSTRVVFNGANVTAAGSPTEPTTCVVSLPHELVHYDCHDVYLYDLASGVTTLVSAIPGGTSAANGNVVPAGFSPDGESVLFVSATATNLLPPGTPHGTIYLRDLAAGTTSAIDATATSSGGIGSGTGPSFSPDGTKVLFSSTATGLVPVDTNNAGDVFLRDLGTGATTLVSTNEAGTDSADHGSGVAVFSPDGTKVGFQSAADNFGPTDTHANYDVYIRDLATGAFTLASTNGSCDDSSDYVLYEFSFSPDGNQVLIETMAGNLGPTDENQMRDLYVHDLKTCKNTLVSARADGTKAGDSLSAGGRFIGNDRVVFWSQADDIIPDADARGALLLATLQPPAADRR